MALNGKVPVAAGNTTPIVPAHSQFRKRWEVIVNKVLGRKL